MKIKQFIEKAIEGGWSNTNEFYGKYTKLNSVNTFWAVIDLEEMTTVEDLEGGNCAMKEVPITTSIRLSEIWLDPLAWQAVGKVEKPYKELNFENKDKIWATKQMHKMIDTLAEGKTIESFIETL